MIYRYNLPEEPIAWKRVGWSRGKAYDQQAHDKQRVRYLLLSQRRHKILKQPCELHVRFYMPVPRSYTKSKKKALLHHPHVSVPDVSNLIKFLEDAAVGVVFQDDKFITDIYARKLYAQNGDACTQMVVVTGEDHIDNKVRGL